MRILKYFDEAVILSTIRNISGPIGSVLRRKYYKTKLKHLGKNVAIETNVHIENPEYITIGDDTWIDKNVILIAGKPTKGERVFIEKENRSYKNKMGELKIGKSCHIAPNVVVQAHGGVEIRDYITLASGSKIYSMSHQNSIAIGSPAKVVKKRFER